MGLLWKEVRRELWEDDEMAAEGKRWGRMWVMAEDCSTSKREAWRRWGLAARRPVANVPKLQ